MNETKKADKFESSRQSIMALAQGINAAEKQARESQLGKSESAISRLKEQLSWIQRDRQWYADKGKTSYNRYLRNVKRLKKEIKQADLAKRLADPNRKAGI